jgi:hypothetical protein
METALGGNGATLGAGEKGGAFGEFLLDIGLPAKQVLGDLGPEEIKDVLSFFYAGMPDRYKDGRAEPHPAEHETMPLPREHWCAAAWEADGVPTGIPTGVPTGVPFGAARSLLA